MDLKYLEGKSQEFAVAIWRVMEDLQEQYLHLELGWNGFIMMVIYR